MLKFRNYAMLFALVVACVFSQRASAQGGTLIDLINSDGRLSTMKGAVNSAELGTMFSGPGPYTIFAPTNAAFETMTNASLTSPNAVRQTLLYHTLQGSFTKAELYQHKSVKTALGKEIRVQNFGNLLLNDSATLVVHDIQAANGTLHLIDVVLDHNRAGWGGEAEAPAAGAAGGDSAENGTPTEPAEPPPPPLAMPVSSVVLTDPGQNPAYRGAGHTTYWAGINSNSTSCKGTTFVVMQQMDGVTYVGSDRMTNPYRGDTGCGTPLPILCLLRDFSTPPASSRGVNYHDGWAGARVKATVPTKGSEIMSLGAANQRCEEAFGAGWRMAEFHDAGYGVRVGEESGWDFWAYGGLHNNQRYWIHVNDQPANPWNSVQPRPAPTLNTWVDQILYPGGDSAYVHGELMSMATGVAAGRPFCKGVTWSIHKQVNGMVMVGSDGKTNPFTGDTSCAERLPVLCIRVDGYTPPVNFAGNNFNDRWSAGTVGRSFPVPGTALTTRESANAVCSEAFGGGWRMATFHDGSLGTGQYNGWYLWAYGGLNTGQRFWIAINDQPANPWNPHAGN